MASDYGLNFGFRISDESVRLSNGRYRTPAAGDPLLIGTAVTIDHDSPGYLKAAPAAAEMEPYTTGLLIQEEAWDRSIFEKSRVDSFDLAYCLKNRLSVITTGAGTKVWMRNTAEQTRIDGRVTPAITMFDPTTLDLAAGEAYLGWDGTTWIRVAPGADTAWLRVTELDTVKGYLEAVFLR